MSTEEKASAILANTSFRMKAEPGSPTRKVSISKDQRRRLLQLVAAAITKARATANIARRADESEKSEYIKKTINITDAMHNVPPLLAEDDIDVQYLRWCFSEVGMADAFDEIIG